MSSPTNGSWNDGSEQGSGNPPYPGYNQGGGFGQQPQGQPQGQGQPQSIGQGYDQQGGFGQPAGAPQGGSRPADQDHTSIGQGFGQQSGGFDQGQGQQGSYDQGQQGFGQPQQQGQGGGFGQQAVGNASQVVSGAGDGIGDLFSDFQFKKGLTEKIASLAFLLTVVWAVIRFVRTLAHAWGSTDFGGADVKNMGGFEAFMTTLEALASLVLTVAIIRIVLELAVNVARIAKARARD